MKKRFDWDMSDSKGIKFTSEDEFVTCEICQKRCRTINSQHLKLHNITVNDYKKRFPNVKNQSIVSHKKHSEKVSKGRKGIIFTKEHKKNLSLSHLGYKPTKESTEKRRIGLRKHWSDPIKHTKHKEALNRPEVKRKVSESKKKLFASKTEEEYQEYCERCRKTINKPEVRKKVKDGIKRWWITATEEEKKERIRKQQEGSNKPEIRERRKKTLQKTYRDHPEKHINSRLRRNRETSLEKEIEEIIKKYTKDYKWNKAVKINEEILFPDFWIFNHIPEIVIECDGQHWHQNREKDNIKDKKYLEKGYSVLRLSEQEIMKKQILVDQLLQEYLNSSKQMYRTY